MSPPSRLALAVVALGASLAVVPPGAAAAQRDLPVAGPLPFAPAHVPDRVVEGVRAAASSVRARTRSLRTPDGHQLELAVSASYPDDPNADQALADFLASRLHGPELGALRVFVGRPDEVNELCGGGDVVACYAPYEQRMYVPGEDVPAVPLEYVLTHEYGHHLAAWRRNDPWDALDWGPKRWASRLHVCAHVGRRLLFPGNQGRHYLDDPGEGFADGYAHLHYPGSLWRFNPLMAPADGVFGAIRRDVLAPWHGPRTRSVSGRHHGRLRIRLRLDGDVVVRLRARRGARYRLVTETESWAAGRPLRAGGGFGIEWCRRSAEDAMTFSVRRVAGAGRFRLTVRYPG